MYIADRNKETDNFEIHTKNGEPIDFSEKDALETYSDIMIRYGQFNVMLLQAVSVNIDVKVALNKL